MKVQVARSPVIDILKAVASQLIVLHHLAAYGPLSAAVQEAAPQLISWLYDHARMAVQVFLVVGGYLAARVLSPGGESLTGSPIATIVNRYLRLAVPYLAALVLAIACAALVRLWMTDESIPSAPAWAQVLAHVFLLQNLLGFESLSAGVWYIAMDFQLFAMMAALLWLGQIASPVSSVSRHLALILVASLTIASLFWLNRNDALDDWALYFFGAYGMGAAAYWAGQGNRPAIGLALIAALAVAALLVDFRGRIAVALAAALVLGFASRSIRFEQWISMPLTNYLGRIAYSLFLVHFPVFLLANGVFILLDLSGPLAGATGMVAAWATSLFAAAVFFRYIEAPTAGLKINRRQI